MNCILNGIWFNIRYARDFLFKGMIASGHEFDIEKSEVHNDHWHVFCKRCGAMAATDTYPARLGEKQRP